MISEIERILVTIGSDEMHWECMPDHIDFEEIIGNSEVNACPIHTNTLKQPRSSSSKSNQLISSFTNFFYKS